MSAPIRIRLSVLAGLGLLAGPAFGQGYVIRSSGYYEVPGGTYSYSPARPTVVLQDPWGRAYTVPLQPKVLYYDTPFVTPQGLYRPTTITVMPNTRRPAVTGGAPAAAPATKPPRIPSASGTFRYDSGARSSTPDTGPPPPAPMPPAATLPSPAPAAHRKPDAGPAPPAPTPQRATDVPPPPAPTTPAPRPKAADVPAVPSVPTLPEVPKVPNLGPSPKDR